MVSNQDYQLLINAKVDTSTIQKQLDTMTKKSVTITPTFDKSGGQTGTKVMTEYTTATGSAMKTVEKFDNAQKSLGTTFTQSKTKIDTMSDSIGKASKNTQTLGAKFIDVTKKVVAFGAVTSIIGTFTGLIYKAVSAVKELDDSIIEFKKVSDFDNEQLDSYTDKLAKLGETVYKSRKHFLRGYMATYII